MTATFQQFTLPNGKLHNSNYNPESSMETLVLVIFQWHGLFSQI